MIDELLKAVGATDIMKISEPIVQAVGCNCILVSNMQGLLTLESDQILLRATKNYNIRIIGSGLICKMMNKNEITVSGKLDSVTWEKKL